jgi:spore coat protein U-like protein
MKKTALAALMGFAGLIGMEAHAVGLGLTATGTFDVSITLTSKCEINSTNAATGAVINNLAMSYTSFQTAAATGSTSFNVRCTDGLNYSLALDSNSVTDDALNLGYTLALSATSGQGNGTDQPITVNGSIAALQAGRCNDATGICANTAATNKQRTLTVSY